jgi:uncharacterized protein (TIGR00297 family)
MIGTQVLVGFLLGITIAALAWRARALSTSGALAAALTGGLIFGFGGLPWAVILLTFFISSSALSRLFLLRKAAVEEKFAKGSRRDWGQVFANGGLGALLATWYGLQAAGFVPEVSWVWAAFVGAMAAVNADTWATELGVLSTMPPRLITTGRSVPRGTSGGVSLQGYVAVLAGSLLVGGAAAFFSLDTERLPLLLLSCLGGLVGSSLDSVLGATVQAIYFCPVCHKETERHPQHSCGAQTTPLRGWRWMNNDFVNFLCSLGGAFAAGLGWWLLFH